MLKSRPQTNFTPSLLDSPHVQLTYTPYILWLNLLQWNRTCVWKASPHRPQAIGELMRTVRKKRVESYGHRVFVVLFILLRVDTLRLRCRIVESTWCIQSTCNTDKNKYVVRHRHTYTLGYVLRHVEGKQATIVNLLMWWAEECSEQESNGEVSICQAMARDHGEVERNAIHSHKPNNNLNWMSYILLLPCYSKTNILIKCVKFVWCLCLACRTIKIKLKTNFDISWKYSPLAALNCCHKDFHTNTMFDCSKQECSK